MKEELVGKNRKSIVPVTNLVHCSLLKRCHNAQLHMSDVVFIIRSRMIKGEGQTLSADKEEDGRRVNKIAT